MKPSLPPLLAAFVAASNTHDSAAFTACFSPEATVHDEGRVHRGCPAIKAWFEEVSRKYRATLVVTDMATTDGATVLTGEVSGNFEGSPIELRYHLTHGADRITALKIAP